MLASCVACSCVPCWLVVAGRAVSRIIACVSGGLVVTLDSTIHTGLLCHMITSELSIGAATQRLTGCDSDYAFIAQEG